MVGLLVALAPIVAVLVLLACRLPSLWAGVAGLVVALVGAAVYFPLEGPQIGAAATGTAVILVDVASSCSAG